MDILKKIGFSSCYFLVSLVIILLITTKGIYSTPETFDHLAYFKKPQSQKNGPIKEIVEDIKNQSKVYAEYQYNEKNQLIRENYYNKEGTLEGYLVHQYIPAGIKKSILYNSVNKEREAIHFRTSKNGKVLSYSVFNENNQKTVSWKFSYDSKGRISSGSRIFDKQKTESFEIEYKKDHIYQIIMNQKGEKSGVITTFLKNGKIISRLKKDSTGTRKIE